MFPKNVDQIKSWRKICSNISWVKKLLKEMKSLVWKGNLFEGQFSVQDNRIIWDENSTGHQTIILGLLAFTIFRSKFDLSNMRGAGERHMYFSFLMNLVLHEEFQMHSNSKANPPIYPTCLNNTKYWTKSFKKCIFFNVRRISEDEWP